MKRNASIELSRLLLMFGICLLHSAINPGYSRAWFINITCFCVTAFAFISGYYGASFRPSKIVRLVGTGVICALICGRGNISRAWGIYGRYWFLHAYVLMMCLAPLVDGAISRKGAIAVAMPLLVAVFVWGDLPSLPFFSRLRTWEEPVFVEIRCLPSPLCHTQNTLRTFCLPASSVYPMAANRERFTRFMISSFVMVSPP